MSKKCLYIECPSGISGDMTIGAFLDLGLVTIEELNDIVEDLQIENLKITSQKDEKCGITGTKFDVIYNSDTKHGFGHEDHTHHNEHGHNHNHHEHAEVHNHHHHSHADCSHNQNHANDPHHHHDHFDNPHMHDHIHCDDHVHSHDHGHNHSHGHHHHANLDFINSLIDNSSLNNNAKELAKKIFNYIAISESKIHGKTINEVHFHEVGAFDSIVDIVLAAYCIDKANVEEVFVSNIHIGTGHVKCDHGILPVPAPATLDILKGLPVYSKGIKSELVTPTGAAILKAVGTKFGDIPVIKIDNIGYGLGTKDLDIANVLRVSIGTL